MSEAPTDKASDRGGSRSGSRLAAVQALYQISVTGIAPDLVIQEFVEHRFGREVDGIVYEGVDRAFFEDVVRGVDERGEEIDRLINATLTRDRRIDRLEKILGAVLRAGVYELLSRVDVPVRAVISEYVDVAHAFFEGQQPGFVNGVLDHLANELRPNEMAAARPGNAAG